MSDKVKKISTKKLKKIHAKNKVIKLDMVEINDFGRPGMKFSNIHFTRSHFKLLRLKDCEINNSSFTQSIISDESYLRHAHFENVDFTGTLFKDTNLEKADFLDCNMDYVRFENCLLNTDSIIKNSLPKKSNLRLGLLNQLYKNELLSNGNSGKTDKLLYLIRETERNEIKDILFSPDEYFKKERKNNILRYLTKYLELSFEKYVCGYGLHIRKIIVTMLFALLAFALLYYILAFPSSHCIPTKIKDSLFMSANSFLMGSLDTDNQEINIITKIIVLIQNGVGILYFALFTSAVYRRIAR